jgi:hypothetical protein
MEHVSSIHRLAFLEGEHFDLQFQIRHINHHKDKFANYFFGLSAAAYGNGFRSVLIRLLQVCL